VSGGARDWSGLQLQWMPAARLLRRLLAAALVPGALLGPLPDAIEDSQASPPGSNDGPARAAAVASVAALASGMVLLFRTAQHAEAAAAVLEDWAGVLGACVAVCCGTGASDTPADMGGGNGADASGAALSGEGEAGEQRGVGGGGSSSSSGIFVAKQELAGLWLGVLDHAACLAAAAPAAGPAQR
jgi:hypothetical protein